jgi:hypothetical protein
LLAGSGINIGGNLGGDPLDPSIVSNQFGSNYGSFWKAVFPNDGNPCDLLSAIGNMQDKINQLQGFISGNGTGNANSWVQANLPKAKQGNAAAYIMHSYGNLKALLPQYQQAYSKTSGCIQNAAPMVSTGGTQQPNPPTVTSQSPLSLSNSMVNNNSTVPGMTQMLNNSSSNMGLIIGGTIGFIALTGLIVLLIRHLRNSKTTIQNANAS